MNLQSLEGEREKGREREKGKEREREREKGGRISNQFHKFLKTLRLLLERGKRSSMIGPTAEPVASFGIAAQDGSTGSQSQIHAFFIISTFQHGLYLSRLLGVIKNCLCFS